MSAKKKFKEQPQIVKFGKMYGLRGHFFVKNGMPEPAPKEPLPALSEPDKRKVARHRDNLLQYMPEVLPIVKELMAEGMLDGWRSVRVRVHE